MKAIYLIAGILMASTLSMSSVSAQPRQTYTYVVNNGTGWTIDVVFGSGSITAAWKDNAGNVREYWQDCVNTGGETWACKVRGNPNTTQNLVFSADNRSLRQGAYNYNLRP